MMVVLIGVIGVVSAGRPVVMVILMTITVTMIAIAVLTLIAIIPAAITCGLAPTSFPVIKVKAEALCQCQFSSKILLP